MPDNAIGDAGPVVVKVDGGRGFVIETESARLVVTAAHCLPRFPPRASISDTADRTYGRLLGAVGKRSRVWAECLFVDPVADIAVFGSPDNQELAREAEAYEALMRSVTPLRVTEMDKETVPAKLLSLSGSSFECVVSARGGGPLWIEDAAQPIVPGMSGSPILTQDGSAIGVVAASDNGSQGGPNPRLASHLPGWLLGDLGISIN